MAEIKGDARVGIAREVDAASGDDASQVFIVDIQLLANVCNDFGGGHRRFVLRGSREARGIRGHVALCGRTQARSVKVVGYLVGGVVCVLFGQSKVA